MLPSPRAVLVAVLLLLAVLLLAVVPPRPPRRRRRRKRVSHIRRTDESPTRLTSSHREGRVRRGHGLRPLRLSKPPRLHMKSCRALFRNDLSTWTAICGIPCITTAWAAVPGLWDIQGFTSADAESYIDWSNKKCEGLFGHFVISGIVHCIEACPVKRRDLHGSYMYSVLPFCGD